MLEDPPAGSHLASQNLYADVIVPRHLHGSFTYIVPPQLKSVIQVGNCVLVPFGRSRVQGAVISLSCTLPPSLDRAKLREISSIVTDNGWSEIPSHLLDLAKEVSEYYVAPWGQCLRLVMPPSSVRRARGVRFKLTRLGRETLTAGHVSNEIRSVLERLAKKPAGIKRSTLCKRSKQDTLLETLAQNGWIVEDLQTACVVNGPRPPHSAQPSSTELHPVGEPPLSVSHVVPPELEERLVIGLKNGQPAKLFLQASLSDRRALLHCAIHHTLAAGRTALVIVGEADRAQWLAETLIEEGTIVSACLSRRLSDDARAAIWQQARRPDPQVIVGTRSAVFLPLQSLGMIWVERDEDPALKEPQEPRYHARDVAWLRARDEGASLILASPHPSVEAALKVDRKVTMLCQELPIALRPKIEVVDLRPLGKGTVLSPPLIEATRETIDRKEGVLLFLNRKGYARALVCRDCGQVPRCESCRVALAYYRYHGHLSCTYCGAVAPIPNTCASCAGHRLQLIGGGTERVEEEVRRQFPDARIIRADGDTMQKPAQVAAFWKCIKDRQWDVLIGTQLILRDYAVPPIGLVAAVQADASLSLPDFRAAERTYHLLRDVVALARPLSDGGRAIIQSHLPSHHAIQAVVEQDDSLFTTEELSHRMVLGYPPAVHLIALRVSGANEGLVQEAAAAWARRLQAFLPTPEACQDAGADRGSPDVYAVLGPVPPLVPKVRGHYRRQILVKSPVREQGIQAVRESIRQLEQAYPTRALKFDVDVDPVEMW